LTKNLSEFAFVGLFANRPLSSVTGPEFMNAIARCGWKEVTGTRFFRELCKDGPTRGITTLGQLQREIACGHATPGRDGKTLHWICGDAAYQPVEKGDRPGGRACFHRRISPA
jgi:hypothetical protein